MRNAETQIAIRTRRRKRTLMGALAVVIGLFVVAVLTLPIWFPWVLAFVLPAQNASYGSYQRDGWRRFVLLNGRWNSPGMVISADRIELPLPSALVWHRIFGSRNGSSLRVSGWTVEMRPLDPSEQRSETPAQTKPQMNSVVEVIDQMQPIVTQVSRWLPHAELTNGIVRLPSQVIEIPDLTWQTGMISATVHVPALNQTAHLAAKLTEDFPWTLKGQVNPIGLRFELLCRQQPAAIHLEGQISWETNQVSLSAQFGSDGWLPISATAKASEFRIPEPLLPIEGYRDLTGSFAAEWNNDRFRIDLDARANPKVANSNLVPVTAEIRLSGDTNTVAVGRAVVRAEGIELAVSPDVAFAFDGKLLSDRATIRLNADLAKQRWFPLSGNIQGEAKLTPSEAKFPKAVFAVTGSNLVHRLIAADELAVQGQLSWPWLELETARVKLRDLPTATLVSHVDLEHQFITNGSIHVEGRLNTNRLTGNLSFDHVRLDAEFAGTAEDLAHSGRITVRALSLPKLSPLGVEANWSGGRSAIEAYNATVSSGRSNLKLSGAASAGSGHVALRFDTLVFDRESTNVYHLEQPFDVKMHLAVESSDDQQGQLRFTVSPLRWTGPDRSLSAQADISWPSAGTFTFNADGIELEDWNGFFLSPLPPVHAQTLITAGGWTNGPVIGSLELAAHAVARDEIRLGARLVAKTSAEGVALEEFEISAAQAPVLAGRGRVPLSIVPSGTNGVLQLNQEGPLEFQAQAIPHQEFWDQVAEWTRFVFVDPMLEMHLSGTLANPAGQIGVQLEEVRPSGLSTNLTIPKLEKFDARIQLNEQAIRLAELSALVEGQRLIASGQVPLHREGLPKLSDLLDLEHATAVVQVAKAKIAPFARFAPNVLSPEGTLDLNLSLRPGLQLQGAAIVQGAATRPLPSVGRIDELEARLKLDGRRIVLQSFSGLLGGQPFAVVGDLDLDDRDPATGMPQTSLQLRGEDLPLARRPDLILRGDLNIRASTETNKPGTVAGTVRLKDSLFLSDLRALIPGRVAHPSERPPFFSIDFEPLASWNLDLQVDGDRFLKVRTPLFRGEISTQMEINGTMREPIALGEVRIDSGTIQFPFANLSVTHGLVTLSSDDPYRPKLFVIAGTRAFGYDVKMEVTGTADSPVIEFSSTPPLSSEQLLLMLTAGEMPREETRVSNQQRASRLALFLGKNLLSEFSSGQGGADRLTLRSGEYLSDEGKQTYSLEYRLTDDWSIVGEYDRFGEFNASLKWRVYSR